MKTLRLHITVIVPSQYCRCHHK